MTAKEILDRLLRAYGHYYDVTRFDSSQTVRLTFSSTENSPRRFAPPPSKRGAKSDASPKAPLLEGGEPQSGGGSVSLVQLDFPPDALPGPDDRTAVQDGTNLSPFAAEAVFHSHEEQFFLVRSARIAEAESHEYVFFALEDNLTADRLRELSDAAWREGTARTVPHKDHRNTDTVLIVLADRISPDAFALVPKLKHYRSYRWGFQGWSHFFLFAVEASTGRCAWNRQGRRLRKLIQSNIREP